MRKLAWSVGIVGLGLFVMVAAEAAKKKPAQPEEAAPPTVATAEDKVAHSFENEDKLKEFAQLWQQRQGTIVRMSVLRAYWDEEQAALAKLNSQITSDYHLDPSKNYTLDAKRRAIIELPEEPAASPDTADSAPAEPPKP